MNAKLPDQHQRLWDLLLQRYAGPRNAAPREKIRAHYNLLTDELVLKITSDRQFRHLVSELVILFRKPICTTSADGYYVAGTPDDLDHAVKDLEARGVKILERARALRQCDPLDPQRRLF